MRVLMTVNNQLQLCEVEQVVDVGNSTIVFWLTNGADFATYNVFNAAGILLKAAETGFLDLSHYFTELVPKAPIYVDNSGISRELDYQNSEELDWREF